MKICKRYYNGNKRWCEVAKFCDKQSRFGR